MNEHEQLADLLDQLRRRIAASPRRSYTAAQARELIAGLERPNSPLSTGEKLSAVRSTLRTYQRGLQYTDPTLEHPGERERE